MKIHTWPRTERGYCSCPYCTAIREGTVPKVAVTPRDWLERVGGRGQSMAAKKLNKQLEADNDE